MATPCEPGASFDGFDASECLLPKGKEKSSTSVTKWVKPRVPFISKLCRPPTEGKTLSLKQFVKNYNSFFPLCVVIKEGYYDPSMNFEVSAGEFYTLKFTASTKSIAVNDPKGKQKLLPTNSHIQCTFLYNPDGDLERARRGYVFPTVGDILESRTRPNVVIATRDYHGDTEETSVDQSEVLVLKKQRQGAGSSSRTSLHVYSVTLGLNKVLPSQCRGEFSTNPYSTKLSVREVLDHVCKRFPAKACFYVDLEFNHEIESCLLDDPLEVTGVRSVKSVVASPNTHADHSGSRHSATSEGQLVELPLSGISIAVSVHPHSDSRWTERHGPQVAESEKRGTKFWQCRQLSGRDYQPLVKPCHDRPYQLLVETQHYQTPGETNTDESTLYESVGPSAETPSCLNPEIASAMKVLEKSLKDTSEMVGVLINEMRTFAGTNGLTRPSCGRSSTGAGNQCTTNSKLSALSVSQVCILLDGLGLPQYKAIVIKERVTGDILRRLTEDELRNELKITSTIHRLRLMDIIDCRVDMDSIISK